LLTFFSAEMQKIFSRAEADAIADRTVADKKKEIDLIRKRVEQGVDRQTNVQEERKPRHRESTLLERLTSRHSPDRQVRSIIPRPSLSDKTLESEIDFIPLEREQVASELRTMRTRSATKRQRSERADEIVLEEERYSVRHGLGEAWDQPVVYPRTGKKRTTVEQRDLVRLDEGEFLNDTLIEFYIRWLSDKFKVLEHQVYFFSTHFYTALTRTQKGQRTINYAAVERWTAKDDIFIHDFVIVPVNEATHWYLAIICNLPNVKRKFALEDKGDDTNDRQISSVTRVGDEEPDVMEIDPTEAPLSPTHNLSIQYSNLKVDKQSQVKNQSKEPISTEPIYVFDEEEERAQQGNVKQAPTTPLMEPLSDTFQNTQTSDIGVFADAKPSPSGSRKAKRKSGPPPRKYDPTQPAVVILDSLNSAHGKTISNLKDYLIAEGLSKRGLELSRDDFQGINAKEGIPQQNNSCDCGLYLLGYIHKFMEDPKQFGHKLLLQEFDLHSDWPNMVPSAMRNGIRNELMQIHAEQKAEREVHRKAKKAAKRTSKEMTAQAAASSPLEKEVVGSTASRGGILKPPSPQVVIDQGARPTNWQNSPGQQPIEDKKSHSPQMSQNLASPKPLREHSKEADAQRTSDADDAMLFDEHPPRTPTPRIQRFQSTPPLAQGTSEMEVDLQSQLNRSAEISAGQRFLGLPADDPVPLSTKPKMRRNSGSVMD
jgi:Ulp1 family protease